MNSYWIAGRYFAQEEPSSESIFLKLDFDEGMVWSGFPSPWVTTGDSNTEQNPLS